MVTTKTMFGESTLSDEERAKLVPALDAIVRPVGSEITYRVVERLAHGCRVEATVTEVATVPGRAPRPLHYSEKRATLTVSSTDGTLFDNRWNAWEVVS